MQHESAAPGMSSGRIIRLPVRFRLSKAGKVERCVKHLDVSVPAAAIVEARSGREGKTGRRDQIGSDLQLSWAVRAEIKA